MNFHSRYLRGVVLLHILNGWIITCFAEEERRRCAQILLSKFSQILLSKSSKRLEFNICFNCGAISDDMQYTQRLTVLLAKREEYPLTRKGYISCLLKLYARMVFVELPPSWWNLLYFIYFINSGSSNHCSYTHHSLLIQALKPLLLLETYSIASK